MEGLYILSKNGSNRIMTGTRDDTLALVLKRPNLEVMRLTLKPADIIWLAAAENHAMLELFYVIDGRMTVYPDDGDPIELGRDDAVYAEHLLKDIRVTAEEFTDVLYITNLPVFDGLCSFNRDLHSLLVLIDEKDSVTMLHSKNVLRYTMALYGELKPAGIVLDDLANAALFHDVGKCYVPDEILKKTGLLTVEEFDIMKLHPINSYDILTGVFSPAAAEIARCHHERLDGSGYPDGLDGADIGMGPRIIAVADAFDAMTTPRTYNRIKTPEVAIAELKSFPRKYDKNVVDALDRLYSSGGITLVG